MAGAPRQLDARAEARPAAGPARVVQVIRMADGARQHYLLTARESQERAAHHEAAHVVVAWRLGIPVRRVSMDLAEAQALGAGLIASTRRGVGTPADNGVVRLAGYVYDEEWQQRKGLRFTFEGGGHHDVNQAAVDAAVARSVAAGEALGVEERALVDEWAQRAARLLHEHRREQHGVAAALLERGALDTQDLEALLGPCPAITEEELTARRETFRTVVRLGYDVGGCSEEEALAVDLIKVVAR